jgi:hypothetical protein
MMKKRLLALFFLLVLLLTASACTTNDYTPPPAQAQKQDKSYESRYNSSQPIKDSWQGEECISLVLSLDVLRMEDEFISHVEISADQTLVGVVAFGRSLPFEMTDGIRIFTLTPDAAEATTLNGGTGFWAQLFFTGDTVPSVRVRRVFNTHTTTSEGVPNPNMEPQRLLSTKEIKALDVLPTIDALPQALHFADEVRYFPETGVYKAHYLAYRWITATPSDGKFEKHMQYEMEHGNYLDIECYPYKNTKYYIIEAWPTGGGVSEEEHTFSIKWEKDGYVYDLYLIRAVTSHEAAKEVVHGIKY